MLTHSILATVEKGRLAKAVEGYTAGSYAITLASQSEKEIRGFVANGDGKEYGVILTPERAFCSCKDSMFRHTTCKHAVVLALHMIRAPKVEEKEAGIEEEPEKRPVNLKLGKVRKGFAFSA